MERLSCDHHLYSWSQRGIATSDVCSLQQLQCTKVLGNSSRIYVCSSLLSDVRGIKFYYHPCFCRKRYKFCALSLQMVYSCAPDYNLNGPQIFSWEVLLMLLAQTLPLESSYHDKLGWRIVWYNIFHLLLSSSVVNTLSSRKFASGLVVLLSQYAHRLQHVAPSKRCF